MKRNPEKRTCERHCYAADIVFSYFNSKQSYNAEILDIGLGGMCFKSNLSIQPGATICIHFDKSNPNGPCSGCCEGLRLVTLADVKWCSEICGDEVYLYGVGVKYFEPVY